MTQSTRLIGLSLGADLCWPACYEEIMRELKRQMDEEAKTLQEKRKQEKEYLQKMLEENERWKRQQGLEREREKLEDIKAQEAYAKMLEKQEKDRELAVKAREART